MSRVLFATFAVILALLAPVSATAQGAADIFTVARVPVEATAASSEAARLVAQDRGRAQALQILLHRLTPSSDWPYLPRPALSELLDMQVGFEVENERFSTLAGAQNRYLANITYAFRRDRIRSLLRNEGMSFSESQASPALVLAVFERAGTRLLWEEDNPWAAAWYGMDFSHELVPMTMALGDLADTTVVPVEDVVAGNWGALEYLANRYGVSRIFVAHGVLLDDGIGNGTLYARITELTANGTGRVIDTQVSGPLPADDVAAGDMSPSDMVAVTELGAQAITLLSGQLQESWKAQTLVAYDVIHRLDATALFASHEDWILIREALETSATVNEYDAFALSSRGAELSITFVGSPQQLMITLAQRGVSLTGTRGYWDLRLHSTDPSAGQGVSSAVGMADTNSSGADLGGSYGYKPFQEPTLPPVETIVMQDRRDQNAPVLSGEDLEGIFDANLSPEEIDARRREELRQQYESGEAGTMAPVGE